eukprot:scaffold3180_cov109-Ochromonas_danica.AAC.1
MDDKLQDDILKKLNITYYTIVLYHADEVVVVLSKIESLPSNHMKNLKELLEVAYGNNRCQELIARM